MFDDYPIAFYHGLSSKIPEDGKKYQTYMYLSITEFNITDFAFDFNSSGTLLQESNQNLKFVFNSLNMSASYYIKVNYSDFYNDPTH